MTEIPPRLTRKQGTKFLQAQGYPISLSVFNKLAMPSRGEGPRVDVWFGSRPLYLPSDLLEWAEARCRTA